MTKNPELAAWLRAQYQPDTPFVQFMEEVARLHREARESALVVGDTEFQKGEVEGLRTVLELPELIVSAGDTEEMPTEKEE